MNHKTSLHRPDPASYLCASIPALQPYPRLLATILPHVGTPWGPVRTGTTISQRAQGLYGRRNCGATRSSARSRRYCFSPCGFGALRSSVTGGCVHVPGAGSWNRNVRSIHAVYQRGSSVVRGLFRWSPEKPAMLLRVCEVKCDCSYQPVKNACF